MLFNTKAVGARHSLLFTTKTARDLFYREYTLLCTKEGFKAYVLCPPLHDRNNEENSKKGDRASSFADTNDTHLFTNKILLLVQC